MPAFSVIAANRPNIPRRLKRGSWRVSTSRILRYVLSRWHRHACRLWRQWLWPLPFFITKDVFLPLAIAVLLTFALAPIVAFFRRAGLPRLVAVITSVAGGFLIMAVFSAVVAFQVSEVGQNISIYQYNIIEKIRTLKEAGSDNSFFDRLNSFVERIGTEINRPEQKTQALPSEQPEEKPLLVQIFSPRHPVETLRASSSHSSVRWRRRGLWSSS